MRQGRRITVERASFSHGFVLVSPPFPEVGDSVTWEGQEWTVTASRPTRIVMVLPEPSKQSEQGESDVH
jgi:hypothetical protein